MTAVTETSIRITVEGEPKPKGSLRHIGRGRLVEQVAGSAPWRSRVAWASREQYSGHPIAVAVVVDFELRIEPPKSAPKRRITLPITRSSGDLDKHARNICDALVDGGVLKDDSCVVELHARKRHCLPGEMSGAVIEIWRSEAPS